jgi:regulation of enolase protein 1 (concanavalin A-like superfamily)
LKFPGASSILDVLTRRADNGVDDVGRVVHAFVGGLLMSVVVLGLRRRSGRVLCRSLRLFLAIVLAMSAGAGISPAAEVVFRDDFSGELADGWAVVRENPAKVSLESRPGYLRILTERGTIGEDSNVKNLYLRGISGDFILDTRIEFDPEAAQQYAGIIVYADDQNAVSIGLAYAAGPLGVFRGVVMLTVSDGEVPSGTPPVAFYSDSNVSNPNTVYLRLLRRGDRFVGGFSENGVLYNDIGTITNDLPAAVSVGLGAANGDSANCAECDISIPADFDYFQASVLDGTGEPQDPDVAVLLESVEISGPDSVSAGGTARFTTTARFSDDTTEDVSADTVWMVAPPGFAEISGGNLSVGQLDEPRQVTLVATYTQLTSQGEVTRHGTKVIRLTQGGPLCGAGTVGMVAFSAAFLGLAFVIRRR